mgnify:CR=1 FL=1
MSKYLVVKQTERSVSIVTAEENTIDTTIIEDIEIRAMSSMMQSKYLLNMLTKTKSILRI